MSCCWRSDRLENHPGVAGEHAQRAKALENRVEDVYREALADLFSDAEDIKHVVQMLETARGLSPPEQRGRPRRRGRQRDRRHRGQDRLSGYIT